MSIDRIHSLFDFLKDDDEEVRKFARSEISKMAYDELDLVETVVRSRVHMAISDRNMEIVSYQDKDLFSSTVFMGICEETGEYRVFIAISLLPEDSDNFDLNGLSDKMLQGLRRSGIHEIVETFSVNGTVFTKEEIRGEKEFQTGNL